MEPGFDLALEALLALRRTVEVFVDTAKTLPDNGR
jgi:hypothetical protein